MQTSVKLFSRLVKYGPKVDSSKRSAPHTLKSIECAFPEKFDDFINFLTRHKLRFILYIQIPRYKPLPSLKKSAIESRFYIKKSCYVHKLNPNWMTALNMPAEYYHELRDYLLKEHKNFVDEMTSVVKKDSAIDTALLTIAVPEVLIRIDNFYYK